MKQTIGVLFFALSASASAQSFEQPRQQVDLYGGGSYQVGVTGSAVMGVQVRQNFGRFAGVGGYYNFSPVRSEIGANAAGIETSGSLQVHDYGAAIELHAARRLQPYILGTLGGISSQIRASARNYAADLKAIVTETHFAYGAGVGMRFHFNRRAAIFAESRLVRAAVSDADYFVRGVVGVTLTLP